MSDTMSDTKIVIAGLGNPGKQYQKTPHNIGFALVDFYAAHHNVNFQKIKKIQLAEFVLHNTKIFLIKPSCFMNLSGEAIVPFCRKNGVPVEKLIVVHDEVELSAGIWKEKKGGGHKGHNGLRNIISMSTADFNRIRIGVGRPPNPNFRLADYLLSSMPDDEWMKIHNIFEEIKNYLDNTIYFSSNQ